MTVNALRLQRLRFPPGRTFPFRSTPSTFPASYSNWGKRRTSFACKPPAYALAKPCEYKSSCSASDSHSNPSWSRSSCQSLPSSRLAQACTGTDHSSPSNASILTTESVSEFSSTDDETASSSDISSLESDVSDDDDQAFPAPGPPKDLAQTSGELGAEAEGKPVLPSRLKKLKGSMRLRKWASIRRKIRESEPVGDADETAKSPASRFDSMIEKEEEFGTGRDDDDEGVSAKEIYIISDGTGWTADNAVQAALGQFDYCFVDGKCPVTTKMYSQIRSVEKLLEILRMAGEQRALVVSTLVESSMNDVAKTACRVMRIPHVDMMDPLLARVEEHLGVTAQRLPRGSPGRKKNPLSKEYFRRIEAVDFTIKQDDGAHPRNLHKADIVLIGVSRTGKTPLSIYLAQKGYKVANVPLVVGVPPPPELFSINQGRIYALTIDPYTLEAIRRSRFVTLGLLQKEDGDKKSSSEAPAEDKLQRSDSLEHRIMARRLGRWKEDGDEQSGSRFGGGSRDGASQGSYYSLNSIRAELEQMHQLFRENPTWPVIDVTGKAVEETAAQILSIRYERIHRNKMPYISRRY